jgi:hypothetical protein
MAKRPSRVNVHMVLDSIGKPLRPDINRNFYLFAFLCLYLDPLDADQVIHEYAEGFGHPSWIHISSSIRQDKRQILMVGSYPNNNYLNLPVKEAIGCGTVKS